MFSVEECVLLNIRLLHLKQHCFYLFNKLYCLFALPAGEFANNSRVKNVFMKICGCVTFAQKVYYNNNH